MNTIVKLLHTCIRSTRGIRTTGIVSTVLAGNGAGKTADRIPDSTDSGGIDYDTRLPEPYFADDARQMAIPVRICPHCGYEIRTWINGDLSCTRCENDIRSGEGILSTPDFPVPGTGKAGSRI